jgi:preprotein translocase subunit SecG
MDMQLGEKMMNKKPIRLAIAFLAICVLFSSFGFAIYLGGEKILKVDITVHSDDRVDINSIEITDGSVTFDERTGDYAILIQDSNKKTVFKKSIYISFNYDGPVDIREPYSEISFENVSVVYNLPYNGSMRKILFYKKDKLLFEREIAKQETEKKTRAGFREEFWIILIVLLAAVLLVTSLIYARRKNARDKSNRKKEKSQQQLVNALKSAGWTEEEIKQSKK